jgi:hypothetical protein
MKATLDIPDELYRRVKARSAMEGRPLRNVAIELFQKWLDPAPEASTEAISAQGNDAAPWLSITRRHLRPGMSHDLESIRTAIGQGWAAETAEKIQTTEP